MIGMTSRNFHPGDDTMFGGLGSPNYGPIGCVGAVFLVLFTVAAIVGLLILAWSPLLFP